MNKQRAKYPLAILTGLTLVGALAGCSTAAADEETTTGTDSGTDSSAESTTPDSGDATVTAGSYTDGAYSASANYTSPGGTETVEVTVTLEGGIITEVEAVGDGDNPNSKRYQGEFSDGIADVVVGKSIDDISVDKVAGSSLTSDGFNLAIDEIKADAAS